MKVVGHALWGHGMTLGGTAEHCGERGVTRLGSVELCGEPCGVLFGDLWGHCVAL